MNKIRSSYQWIDLVPRGDFLRGVATGLLAFALVGCGGGGGSGSAVPPASGGGDAPTALNITITGVTINSPPVVTFTVTDQTGVRTAILAAADLRFNIAKLMPGSDGAPTIWQNYINRAVGGAVQGTQERSAAGFAFGTLVNQGNGSYTYTFATDIRNPAANPCPAPCTDANGKPLDISYQPGLTHRVAIQQANSAYPNASGVYDFVPAGGAGTRRDVVATATCNACHNELTAHGTRVDTRLCVTCHNPGSWVAGTSNITVDFKVMIHKIHNGSSLPSVVAGTPYIVNGTDFSKVAFPQDVRNCTKCHDGTPGAANATAQGDNWKMQPNMDACGSCHDDVYFGARPDPAKPYQRVAHPGGVTTDSSTCALCHAAGRFTDNKDIVVAHNFPARFKAAAAKFKYNIISVTPTTAGGRPVIIFSVTDPTNADKPYDIKSAAAFTAGANSTLTVKLGWSTSDFGNDGSGQSFGQPVSINLLNNPAVVAGITAGTYTVTSTLAVPATQTGTLRVMMEGHPAGDVTTAGSFTDRLAVKSVFKDSAITGSVVARRIVVDIAKCNVCHNVLSLHGNNRTDEPGVCAVCHNPNATDANQRPKSATGVLTGGVDGKLEESIDFKTMIHGIHAGQADKGGFRTKGITIYGFGGGVNDFSNVVFPGKLNDCTACHTGTSYQLTGIWDAPTANGILGNTISTGASASNAADNLRITPIAAVCSSCHDSAVAKLHMQDTFNAANFSATQATINAAAPEACSFCHGAGRVLDVKVVHGVK
jgi:OmcA/MtrC family decaheme c-type cytochrome